MLITKALTAFRRVDLKFDKLVHTYLNLHMNIQNNKVCSFSNIYSQKE